MDVEVAVVLVVGEHVRHTKKQKLSGRKRRLICLSDTDGQGNWSLFGHHQEVKSGHQPPPFTTVGRSGLLSQNK